MKKVVVIANKNWEVEPLLNAVLNKKFRPSEIGLPTELNHPREIAKNEEIIIKPRAIYDVNGNSVEIWCIQDLMDLMKSSSSSAEKIRILPQIFQSNPDGIIAFGTAGFPGETSYNGSVVIGSHVYLHNPVGNTNPQSPWSDPQFQGKLLTSGINKDFFSPKGLDQNFRNSVESRFITPPNNPGRKKIVNAALNYLALGIVNITNYDDYAWADHEGAKAIEAAAIKSPISSIETTHGLIRIQSEKPFIFVSGITDRLGYFNMEVNPNEQAQNYVAAFNAGIATAWMLPKFINFL